jgi:ribose transport system permease protein
MKWLRQLGPVLALVVLIICLTIASPFFLTVDNLLNIFRQSAINALLALGQLMVIITAGIDLSVGSIMGLCSVVAAKSLKAGHPVAVSMIICLAAGTGFGWLNGTLLTRLKLPHPFIATLGTMNIARGLVYIISDGVSVSELPQSFRFLGASTVGIVPMPVIVVVIVYSLFHFFLNHHVAGRDIYAIGGNQQAAWFSGIPVAKRLVLVYIFSGLLAAIAAIVLTGRMNAGFPQAGVGAELDSIAAVIIGGASFFGGVGNVWGTLVGSLIMGVLRNGLNLLNVSTHWQTVVVGSVIIWAVWIDVARQRMSKRSIALSKSAES